MTDKNSGLAAQIHPIDCPMCRQPVRVPTLEMIVFHYGVTDMESRVLEAIWKGRGLPVTTQRIFDAMYADDPDGGPPPTRLYGNFKFALHHLRRKLVGSGVSIVNQGYGQGYRLVFG